MVVAIPVIPTPGRSVAGAALAFGLGLVLLLAACNELARRWHADLVAPKYQALFAGAPRYPLVLFGTSHTFHGVDPAGLERPGRAVYNFAFPSGNPTFYRAFYADLKAVQGAPQTLYFGVDAMFLKRSRYSRHYAQDSEFWPWPVFWSHLGHVDGGAKAAIANRFPLIKQREAFQDAITGVPPFYRYLTDRAYHGYLPLAPAPMPAGLQITVSPDDPAFKADFLTLLATLRTDGVRVVMFQTPDYRLSGDHAANNREIAAIARSFGIPFLNYNGALRSAINQDATAYNDFGHLNLRGAERFTPVLRRDLEALGAL